MYKKLHVSLRKGLVHVHKNALTMFIHMVEFLRNFIHYIK